jgi:hypothetical protein
MGNCLNYSYVRCLILMLFVVLIWSMNYGQEIIRNLGNPEIDLLPIANVNTGHNERDFAMSPSGDEIYFTRVFPKNIFSAIYFCKKLKNGTWSKPKIASFSGKYSELEPSFSPDGKRLYFASKRPISNEIKEDFDILYVERTSSGWSEPNRLSFNTSSDEFYPSVSNSGNIYFTASYNSGQFKEDIYVSKFLNQKYEKPVPLDSAINTTQYEFNAFVAPDESYIIYTAYGRAGDKGGGDLYLSQKIDGIWQQSVQLEDINSPYLDYSPFVSYDKTKLYFSSERIDLQYKQQKWNVSNFASRINNPQNGNGDIYNIKFSYLLPFLKN